MLYIAQPVSALLRCGHSRVGQCGWISRSYTNSLSLSAHVSRKIRLRRTGAKRTQVRMGRRRRRRECGIMIWLHLVFLFSGVCDLRGNAGLGCHNDACALSSRSAIFKNLKDQLLADNVQKYIGRVIFWPRRDTGLCYVCHHQQRNNFHGKGVQGMREMGQWRPDSTIGVGRCAWGHGGGEGAYLWRACDNKWHTVRSEEREREGER
eukprot:9470052-Pyramimonas_sp.AAC.1